LFRYLKQTKLSFSKTKDRKVKQVLPGGMIPVGEGEDIRKG
jgi:hypothetical protein